MRSFIQYIEESINMDIKGWINPKTKKSYITKSMRPFHVEFIAKKPRDFGISEKDILRVLEKWNDSMDAPDPAEDAKNDLSDLKTGKRDMQKLVEYLAMKKGWYRVVGADWSEITGLKINDKIIHDILNIMEDERVIPYDGKGIKSIICGEYRYNAKSEDYPSTKTIKVLEGDAIVRALRGKKTGKRTEIGRTMAQFREAVDPKTLLNKFNTLKKGDTIKVKYKSSMTSSKAPLELVVTSGKRTVGKAKVERIILKSKNNPRGVKYYLYNRDGKVSFAIGDMGASLETLDEGVRDAIKKLAKNKKVMGLVSKMKGKSIKQLAVALAALPVVTDTLSNPDRMNQMRIIANGLKTMVEDNEDAIV